MKTIILLGLAAESLASPQLFGKGGSGGVKAPATVRNVEPKLDKAAKRQIIRWGPYKLQGAGAKRSGFHLDANGDAFGGQLGGICNDCMFLSGATYLTYENESRADVATGVYNHHVAIFDLGKTAKAPLRCGFNGLGGLGGLFGGKGKGVTKRQVANMPGMTQLFGSGDDGLKQSYFSKDSNLKTGFYIGKNDKLMHTSEFVNYKKEPQTVWMTADVEFIPGKPSNYLDAMMGAASATGCLGVGYNAPKGKRHVLTSSPFTVTVPGYMYNMHAHLHDGGVNIVLKKNGELVCDSKAIYGGDKGTTSVGGEKWETIQDYNVCEKAVDIKVGDKITIESTYDTTLHRLRPGATDHSMGAEAMGIMGYSFAAKK